MVCLLAAVAALAFGLVLGYLVGYDAGRVRIRRL